MKEVECLYNLPLKILVEHRALLLELCTNELICWHGADSERFIWGLVFGMIIFYCSSLVGVL